MSLIKTLNNTAQYEDQMKQQDKIYEESQKAVEIDFLKQEESFRKRLAMRKNNQGWHHNDWGSESTIKMDSILRANLTPEQSVDLNASDMNLGKLTIRSYITLV